MNTEQREQIIEYDFNRIDEILYNEFLYNPYYNELARQLMNYYENERIATRMARFYLWKEYVAKN